MFIYCNSVCSNIMLNLLHIRRKIGRVTRIIGLLSKEWKRDWNFHKFQSTEIQTLPCWKHVYSTVCSIQIYKVSLFSQNFHRKKLLLITMITIYIKPLSICHYSVARPMHGAGAAWWWWTRSPPWDPPPPPMGLGATRRPWPDSRESTPGAGWHIPSRGTSFARHRTASFSP